MNIHEHQAKEILKKYGAIVPAGVFSTNVDDLIEKAKNLNTEKVIDNNPSKEQIECAKNWCLKYDLPILMLKVLTFKILTSNLISSKNGKKGSGFKSILPKRVKWGSNFFES